MYPDQCVNASETVPATNNNETNQFVSLATIMFLQHKFDSSSLRFDIKCPCIILMYLGHRYDISVEVYRLRGAFDHVDHNRSKG